MTTHTDSPITEKNLHSDVLNIPDGQSISIEKYLESLDQVHDETAIIRNQMISQMRDVVAGINFNVNDEKLDDVDKKLHAVDMLHKLVEAKEKSMTNRVNMRLKNKMSEGMEDLGKIAADLLTKIDLSLTCKSKNSPIPAENLHDLECVVSEMSIDIPETETRTDPYDMKE